MWKFKSLAVTVVLLGVLVFGAVVAQAGWHWNSAIDVEGVEIRTQWKVVDDQGHETLAGEDFSFFAEIEADFPAAANATIVEQATTESVLISYDRDFQCKEDGFEAEFFYKVTASGPVAGNKVIATIKVNGEPQSEVTGHLGERLELQLFIPANNPPCAGAADGDDDYADDD